MEQPPLPQLPPVSVSFDGGVLRATDFGDLYYSREDGHIAIFNLSSGIGAGGFFRERLRGAITISGWPGRDIFSCPTDSIWRRIKMASVTMIYAR